MSRNERRARPPLTRSWTRARICAGLIAVAVFALARGHPAATERLYARALYPELARGLSRASGIVPFSLAEFVFAAIVVGIVVSPFAGLRRARRIGRSLPSSLLAAALRLAAALGGTVSLFLLLWGLNYARPRADTLFGLPEGRLSGKETDALADGIGSRLDRLRRTLPEDEHGIVRMPDDFRALDAHLAPLQAEVLEEHGLPAVRSGRIKPFLSSPLLLRWNVSGIYGPFTGEPNVVLPPSPGGLPFTLAHERAHLSGFAREDEASFVALLTVWRSDRPEVRYSGWLELWMALRRPSKDRDAGVRRDIAAVARFIREHAGREAPATRGAYDAYLRTVGVPEGVASYTRVADLALRFLARRGMPAEPEGAGGEGPS